MALERGALSDAAFAEFGKLGLVVLLVGNALVGLLDWLVVDRGGFYYLHIHRRVFLSGAFTAARCVH